MFLSHGAQKLFVFGLSGVAGAFSGLGVPLAGITGPAVAFLEFFGGLALLLGLFTSVTGIGLAGVMLGANFFAHLPGGFSAPEGVEFVLTLYAAAVSLAITGPDNYPLDAVLKRGRSLR